MTTRRQLLLGAAAVAGGVALRPATDSDHAAVAAALPNPASSGIDHIVVVCMENRSFDHLLGWLPGARGRQAGLSYLDSAGVSHSTYHLTTYQGCGHPDPDHSYQGGRVEYDNGACDGWLRVNDAFSIGYYRQSDLPFLGRAAPLWTVCDNYFAATMAETIPNRLYLHAAQTDRIDGSTSTTTLPTIWDNLRSAGVTGRYYYNDVPVLALWGQKYLDISRPFAGFLADAAAGTLPRLSYVDPPFLGEQGDGTSADDHPHGDIRNGDAFLNSVYQAVVNSPAWSRTVLVVTFDEWGGFFDHVPPTTAPDANPSLTGLRGFRVPAVVVSPLAHRGAVAHRTYDHTSILKMVEWRFGLPALTPRDAAANNLAEVLNLGGSPNLTAATWPVSPVVAPPCAATGTRSGWPLFG
jgi:phospholipase C